MGLFDFFDKAKAILAQSDLAKEQQIEAERFASQKKFKEAVTIAEKILAQWSEPSSWGKQVTRQFLLGYNLEKLEDKLINWKSTISTAEKWAKQAKVLADSDSDNPFETEIIVQAINLYKQCNRLIYDKDYQEVLKHLEQQLEWRQRFQTLFASGEESVKTGFYKQGLNYFSEAQEIFRIPKVNKYIAFCQNKIPQEEKYEAKFNQSRQLAIAGHFKEAFLNFKPVYQTYPRADGQELLKNLQRLLKGKKLYLEGLIAEKKESFSIASVKYEEALKLLPELTECKTRLAIVAIKNKNWNLALSFLQEMEGKKAIYLRGFVYAKQGELQQADREWRFISDYSLQPQREILKILARRERLQIMQAVEQFLDEEKLESAQSASFEFINKYGVNPTIQSNLEAHIQPRLCHLAWEHNNWHYITSEAEKEFIDNQDLVSLHNWVVASYYQAQTDSNQIKTCSVALFTALANLPLDPSLHNVPWMGNEMINLEEVSTQLMQQLEEAIDRVKDSDLEEYFRLRDRYRLDKVALRVMGSPPSCGLSVKNNVFLTPGCYQRHSDKLPQTTFPEKIWGALYTNWGEAVAACLEGDTARAILIKPETFSNSPAEYFSYIFVSYHEGCYYLQNKEWRKAVSPFEIAKTKIKESSKWSQEIDRLCEIQRQGIKRDDIEENLKFAQFWYNLLASQSAASYLAEYKTEKIRENLVNEKINLKTALKELNEIKSIDSNNPVLLDLIENVEVAQEAEEIEKLLNNDNFEEAVKRAKRSRHDRIRYMVAEICIDILLKGAEKNRLPYDMIRQLGRWAYELCPNEPAFKPIYIELKIPY